MAFAELLSQNISSYRKTLPMGMSWRLSSLTWMSRYGFPLMYDLMTQTVKFKIHPNDGPHKWGRMLFRLIPASDFKTLSAEMSILRILAENPQLAGHPSIPRFQIDCVINKIRGMFAG